MRDAQYAMRLPVTRKRRSLTSDASVQCPMSNVQRPTNRQSPIAHCALRIAPERSEA